MKSTGERADRRRPACGFGGFGWWLVVLSCSGGWCGVWSGGVVCGSVGGGGPAGRLPGCLVVPVVWCAGVVVEWLSPRRGWGPLVGFPAPCGDGVWSGGLLLSHTLPRAVPSALEGLTSGFGMGPGVSLPPWPPARSLTPDGGAPGPGFPVRVSRTTQWTRAPAVTGPPPLRGAGCVGQASRPFGIGQLHASRRFHVRPINPVVCRGPYQHGAGESSS